MNNNVLRSEWRSLLVRRWLSAVVILVVCTPLVTAQVEQGDVARDDFDQDDASSIDRRIAALEELNRHLIFNAQTQQLQQAWAANDLSQTRYWLQEQLPDEGEDDLRGFTWHYYNRLSQLGHRLDHGGRCTGVAFSPDGKTFASVGESGVKLWDVANSQPVGWLEHESATHVAFSPDGTQLATWSAWRRNTSMKLWSVESSEPLLQIDGANFACFSPAGQRLAVVVDDKVQIVDAIELATILVLEGHTEHIHDVAFSPDGALVATGGHDRSAKVWDAVDGSVMMDFTNETGRVEAVAFGGNGDHLLITEFAYGVRMFDLESGQEIDRFRERVHFNDYDTGFALSRDGTTLALASRYVTNSRVDVFDLANGTRIKQFVARKGDDVYVTFASAGPWMAVSRHSDRTIEVWNTESWEESHSFVLESTEIGIYGQRAALSPDGAHLVVADGNQVALFDLSANAIFAGQTGFGLSENGEELIAAEVSDVKVYDVETGQVNREFKTQHDIELLKFAVASDGSRILASRPRSSELYLWEDENSEPRPRTLLTHEDRDSRAYPGVTALSLSPSGRFFAAAGQGIPLQVYDLQDQELLHKWDSVESVYISAISDSGILATVGGDAFIRLWDVRSGESLGKLEAHRDHLVSLVFSNDGQYLASQDIWTARLWSVAEQSMLHEVEVRTSVSNPPSFGRSLAFLPDASHLIVGGDSSLIQVDVTSGETDAVFSKAYWHDNVWNLQRRSSTDNQWSSADEQVTLVAVSRDGERIAAQFHDGRCYVWNRADQTGHARIRLEGQATEMHFSRDDRHLIVCGTRIHLIDLASSEQRRVPSPQGEENIYASAYSPVRDQVATTVVGMRRVGRSSVVFSDVRLWDASTGERIQHWTPNFPVWAVGFAPGTPWVIGAGAVTTARGQVSRFIVWDSETGEQVGTHEGAVTPFAISPSGQLVASGNRTVRIWALPTGEVTYEFQSETTLGALAFAPETAGSSWLALAGEDHIIRLLNYANGRIEASLVGHSGEITALAFSTDGRTLVSSSSDETLRVWDLATFSQRASLLLEGETNQLSFSPGGRTIGAALRNGTIRMFRGSGN